MGRPDWFAGKNRWRESGVKGIKYAAPEFREQALFDEFREF
jgi:hypothetical protein